MKKPSSIALLALLVLTSAISAAAQPALAKSPSLPKVDGSFVPGEYKYEESKGAVRLGATLGSDDMLYLAIEAPTEGWAGIGVGGLKMNGSRLFLAAVKDGKPEFIEKQGVNHFYTDAKELVVKGWSVKTEGGLTTLEVELPSSAALWKGKINEIFAYAKSTDFTSRHASRGSISYDVK